MGTLFVITHKHIAVIVLIALLVGGSFAVVSFEHAYQNRFFPHVVLGGEDVGGKSYDEVLRRIQLVGEALRTNGLQLVVSADNATSTISIPQRSFGLTPDVVVEYFDLGDYDGAVASAFAIGRTGNIVAQLRQQLGLLVRPQVIALPVSLREPAIESLLTREFGSLLKKPKDAAFVRQGDEVVITDATSGETADVSRVVFGIREALVAMRTNRLQLRVREALPQVTKEKLNTLADFAAHMSRSLRFAFTYRGSTAYASGATVATWMSVKPGPGVSLVVQREKLADFIRLTINEHIDDAPRNSRFAMRDGRLVEIAPGVAGSGAAIDMLQTQLEKILNERYLTTLFPPTASATQLVRETITLPVEFIQEAPRVTAATVAQYNINDLIGSATTSFKGSSASRKHNIATGVERASGFVIAPGQEFSLVDAIGAVSEETGFEKEYVIKGDRSVKEAGGGLCQLATTVFRAALSAGFPITERQNHSYVVGYYGPGLDATIYGPHPDLKFVNDTGAYVLFQMKVVGDSLVAEFYGTDDHRSVAIGEPKLFDYINPPPDRYIPAPDKPWGEIDCTEQPRRGLTAEATYAVTYADGRVSERVFKSVYQPWPKICLVGVRLGAAPVGVATQ